MTQTHLELLGVQSQPGSMSQERARMRICMESSRSHRELTPERGLQGACLPASRTAGAAF